MQDLTADAQLDDDIIMLGTTTPSLDLWILRACHYGLSAFTFQCLLLCGAPPALFNIIWALYHDSSCTNARDWAVLDYFAGAANFFTTAEILGWVAAAYDILLEARFNDVLGIEGFLVFLQLARGIMPGGFASFATLCTSWIWLCRRTTRRTRENPLGDETQRAVPSHLMA